VRQVHPHHFFIFAAAPRQNAEKQQERKKFRLPEKNTAQSAFPCFCGQSASAGPRGLSSV
jgi:hypothetical protein